MDGVSDLLMSGWWHEQLGPKAFITIVYRKVFNEFQKRYYLQYDHEVMGQMPDLRGQFIAEDMDGDGDEDVLASGRGRDERHKILCFENKDGSFQRVRTGPWHADSEQPLGANYAATVVPNDLNADGFMDFICFPLKSNEAVIALLNVSVLERGSRR